MRNEKFQYCSDLVVYRSAKPAAGERFDFVVKEDYAYRYAPDGLTGQAEETFRVSAGEKTDFASVPCALLPNALWPPTVKAACAAACPVGSIA